jgi:Hemerythrin HHE cation binding domain
MMPNPPAIEPIDATTAGDTAAPQDALSLLKSDHDAVGVLFMQYERLGSDAAPADRSGLAARICGQLQAHSLIEEELFYPALHNARVSAALLEDAQRAHAQADGLVETISSMQPEDEGYDAKIKSLIGAVRGHVDEEQTRIFPAARDAGIDLGALGEALARRKAQVMPHQGAD